MPDLENGPVQGLPRAAPVIFGQDKAGHFRNPFGGLAGGQLVSGEILLRDVLLKGPEAAVHLERRLSSLEASRFRRVSRLAHKMRCRTSCSLDRAPVISS